LITDGEYIAKVPKDVTMDIAAILPLLGLVGVHNWDNI